MVTATALMDNANRTASLREVILQMLVMRERRGELKITKECGVSWKRGTVATRV